MESTRRTERPRLPGGATRREGITFNHDVTLNKANNAQLTMYTTSWCGYCYRLKTVLKGAGISYTEVDIEDDPAAAEFVGSVNDGNKTVPTVKFADGSTLTNPGLREIQHKLAG
jgi:mycoredoxin